MKKLRWIGAGIGLLLPGALWAQLAFHDSLNGIYWAPITPPSRENFQQCQILREGLGYVLGSTGTLYEFEAARPQPWRSLPRPNLYLIQQFFALSPENIWAMAEVPAAFSYQLFHWDGARWSNFPSPNVNRIRDFIFVSSDEGWLGCEYGEMWHFSQGRWEQEQLPTLIHINKLELTADGNLFAIGEAPEQGAVLWRTAGKWQSLFSATGVQPKTVSLSPAQVLFIGYTGVATPLAFAGRPIQFAPIRRLEFFPNGWGYGLGDGENGHKLYAFHDTTYFPLLSTAGDLQDLALFNPRFSWLVGQNGLILAPSNPTIQQNSSASPERYFSFQSQNLSQLYGMAVLQDRPGQLSNIYFLQTGAANLVYARQDLLPQAPFINQAERLNLAGIKYYADRYSSRQDPLTNYDQAVTTGDLNGDGWEDIVVIGMYGHPFIYLHSGHDYYFDATDYSDLHNWGYIQQRPMLANLFDADHDGDLDLFVACQFQSNAFFVNDGRGRFTEVGQAAGLATDGGGIGGYVADFDGDGWDDLYVTCAGRPNRLYRNLKPDTLTGLPRFADVSAASGEACPPTLKQSQGAAIADYDNDGDFDIFVCNLWEGNQLLQNNGKGFFTEVSAAAGLAGRDLSIGATFFDADQDGHLDLVLANRGADRFYKNLGTGRFVERTEQFDRGEIFKGLILNSTRQLGGYSYGTLAVDLDDDADLDLLISNYDTGLFVFENWTNDRAATIQIFLEGIVSNRSAVGAKVALYRAGTMGQPDSLVGLRQIESASSFGCSPAKVAHFGVDRRATYNAKIFFPSGNLREVHGLRGGDARLITELDKPESSLIKAQRALANLFWGYRRAQRGMVFLLGGILLAFVLLAGKKWLGLSSRERKQLAFIFAASLLICHFLWFAPAPNTFVWRPLLMSLSLTLLTIVIWRGQRLYQARPASIEMLQIRLNAFEHGSLIHQLLNRFTLLAENLAANGDLPPAARDKLAETSAGLLHLLNHEIRAILQYQYGNNFAMESAFHLETVWRRLKKTLTALQRQLAAGERLDHAQLIAAVALQKKLRELIPAIKKQVHERQRLDVVAALKEFIQRAEQPTLRLLAPPPLPPVRMAAADIIYVLDELLQNALHNMDGRPPQIDIALRAQLDEVQIDVTDNGKGIPAAQWEEIFRYGFTTKPHHQGGFGLYHARQRLEKYGGKLFVAQSEVGKGTTMRICLQAEIENKNTP